MDAYTPAQIAAIPLKKQDSYRARSQKGDIIVVMPDGHVWGRVECLPEYIVVKAPGVTLADARQYAEPLYDNGAIVEDQKLIRVRKWHVPVAYVDAVIAAGGVATISRSVVLTRLQEKVL
jgi:hypothetical protein